VAGSGIDLIMLRNPWGKTEWKGAWADESKEWAEHPDVDKVVKASDAVKSNEVKRGKNDGIFWMAASDFAKIFSFIDCVLFDAGSRKLQAMQEQAVGLAPTALALEGCVKPPPNPVSTRRASTASAALETNLPKAASCLGRYKKLARQINGRPAWYNVDVPDRFLTFSGNAWNVQRKEKLGWPVGFLSLADPAATSPDISTASWQATAGQGLGWQPSTVTCYDLDAAELPPPKALLLEGVTSGRDAALMAKYTLVDDRLVEGRHIWCAKGVKAFGDVFIAWHDGTWQIQHEEAFGQPRGFLFVHDMAPTPDLVTRSWTTGGADDELPQLVCSVVHE